MTDQEKVKARIQQEILDKLTSKLLDELKIKDYQIRVIKCDLIKARIEKKIEENNIYMTNARYDSTAAMYANKQLNEIYNMISTIMLEWRLIMPKFIVKVYKLYRGNIITETYKPKTLEEMTRAVNVFKCFRYVYCVKAGELIYTDTDNSYYKERIRWVREK